MPKWNDTTTYTSMTQAEVATSDLLPIADASEDDQRTVTVGTLAQVLGALLPYDLTLGFTGTPTAGALDWLLVAQAVTIDASDPGEAFPLTNPADGDWIGTIEKNGSSAGTVTIATDGTISWSIASDIILAAGDRIGIEAPDPADSALSDVQVVLKGTLG